MQGNYFAETPYSTNNLEPEFKGRIQRSHRRANSDNLLDFESNSHPLLWTDNILYYLPKSIVDEINESDQSSSKQEEPASLDAFESTLSSHGVEGASKLVYNIIKDKSDEKEKGKILRAAAEMAKRMSETLLSMELYEAATTTDPTTQASWIDRAKLLDELGRYTKAEAILQEGVRKVQHPEQLIRKLLKSFERTNKLAAARAFLGSIVKDPNMDREVVLTEGGLFEMRQGNVKQAMEILCMVMGPTGWKPNIYSELVQYYERTGMIHEVFDIVEEGARLNPRNAIVCQALLKNQPNPVMAIQILKESSSKWTTEFADKMTSTVCETLARRGHLRIVRPLLAEAVARSSSRQRYKLMLTACIIELMHGDSSLAPLLVDLTVKWTPYKARPMVSILWAKILELNGEYEIAQPLFEKATRDFSAEWRVFLELAQFHVHRNRVDEAIKVIELALKIHEGSGRLWAFRVQLEAFIGVEEQINMLRKAINSVPKSGEVWCEAARIALNPLTEYFNLASAKKYLEFAYRFTPQHGDSLIEMLRIEVLEKGPYSDFTEIKKKFMCSEGNYGLLFIFIRHLDERPLTEVFNDALREVQADIARNRKVYARAMARSSFVTRSSTEREKFERMKSEQLPSKFAFGLTNFAQMMLNPSLCQTREQTLSIILGTSACGTY